MKRFIKKHKEYKLKSPKKGIIIASCLDNRTEIFLEFCRQHKKLTKSKSIALFTNKRIFNEYKNESKDFLSIIINIPSSQVLLEELCLKGWDMIRGFESDSIDNLLHNTECAFKLDRHIKGSLRHNLDYEKGVSLIAGIIYPYIKKLNSEILENSVFITEGTTFVDIVLSNLLENFGTQTIVFSASRIPKNYTLIHKDLHESNFLYDNLNPIEINKHNLNKKVNYPHDFIPSVRLITKGKFLKGFKQAFKSAIRIIKEFFQANDTFNRPSFKGILNKYMGTIIKPLITFLINKLQNFYPDIGDDDLVFYTHISPERSVDIISCLPVEIDQKKLIHDLCKLSRKFNRIFLLLHWDEFKATNIIFLIYLQIKYSHVFIITKCDKFSRKSFFVTITGSVILERALKGLYTFHSSDTYFSKLLPSYKYYSAYHLISLIKNKIGKNNVPDQELIKKIENIIPSNSIEKGYLYEYPLNKKLIKDLIGKLWFQV